jgi:hypothetical protein
MSETDVIFAEFCRAARALKAAEAAFKAAQAAYAEAVRKLSDAAIADGDRP